MKKNKFKVTSLFSGCGGMDLGMLGGFEYLGNNYSPLNIEITYAMDYDKPITGVYNENLSHECFHQDILNLDEKDVPKHDILTGGFPCQSFSVVAQNPKRLGYKDKRGKLFFEMSRILKHHKPTVFIAENVKGLLSANKGEAFPLILKEFENTGYHVKYQILNASHYGVPQKRERVFIIGFKNIKHFNNFKFPKPTTLDAPIALNKILLKDNEIDEKYFFSDKAVAGMKKSKNSRLMNKGRAQNPNEPCNTVGAHLAKVSLNSTDPVMITNGKYRMFTPREAARIQSFPDSFDLTSSKTTNYKALGNAVAPVVMWHLTKQLLSSLE